MKALEAFARLLNGHAIEGTRPDVDPTNGRPSRRWTNEALAAEISSSRTGAARPGDGKVAATTVGNWRHARSLPPDVGPILDALFGAPPATFHKAAYDELLAAFKAAQAEKLGDWRIENDHFVQAEPLEPADLTAARHPHQRAAQADLKLHAEDLQEPTLGLANSLIWRRLPDYARRLAEIAALAPDALVPRLGEAYTVMLAMVGNFHTDSAGVTPNPDAGRFPLEPEARQPLNLVISIGLPWLLEFPSIAARDARYGRFMSRSLEELPATRTFFRLVAEQKLVSRRASEELETLSEAAERDGPAATKAQARAADQAGGLVRAFAGLRENPDLGSPDLTVRVDRILAEPETQGLVALQPQDVRDALATPDIPDDVEAQARALILEGRAPPNLLRPHIRGLGFPSGSQVDLDLLSALTALEFLDLSGTQVSDVSALSALTALESLNLYGTQVSDVSALSALTALESLYLDGTQVSDVSALSALTHLKSLSLNRTQVSDVSALSALTALERLYLNGTQVSDVSALSALTALTIHR